MKAKKFRGFDEGGSVTPEDLSAANAASDPIRALNKRKGWTKDEGDEPKNISFGEAFKTARTAGLKQFTFNGKKFTTELASTKKATPATQSVDRKKAKSTDWDSGQSSAAPDSLADRVAKIPGGDGGAGSGGYDVQSGNPLVSAIQRLRAKYGGDIQNTANAVGGSGALGALSSLGRMGRGAVGAASGSRELAIPESAVRFAGRSEPRLMNAQRLGMDAEDTANAMVPVGAMKRGGKVKAYAKGGSVSSASKRADGIAQRGKTRA